MQLLLQPLAPEPERPSRAGRQLSLEVGDIRADGVRRFRRGVGEIAEDVQVVQRAERARQILFDEAQRAAQALEADLDENSRRVLDVVARRADQTRHLADFRQNPARALRQRRVVEEDLPGQAGRDQVAVVLRIALPRADCLELEETRADVGVQRGALQPLDLRQPRGIDRRQPPLEPAEITALRVDRGSAQVLEQVVVQVNAVERCVGGMGLVQPRQVLVDEMGQRFGRIHSGRIGAPRMAGILYVVATPIGNLEDVTLRALRILREVSVIAAEDTRRTARLLQHYSITTRTTSLHEHNEREKSAKLIERLLAGESIALVSDAGNPIVSDPGQTLVAEARAAGGRGEPVPGPSAVLAALSASGLPAPAFTFLGFPPSRSKDRETWFASLAQRRSLAIFFEAPHRIAQTLTALAGVFGLHHVIGVGRELTKVHEQLVVCPIIEAMVLFSEPKGEFTLLFPPADLSEQTAEPIPDATQLRLEIGRLTNNGALKVRDGLKILAERYGTSVNHLYKLISEDR